MVRKGVFDQSVFKGYPDLIENIENEENIPIALLGLKHLNLKKESEKIKKSLIKEENNDKILSGDIPDQLINAPFVHLHNNSQFSVLQSTIHIKTLIEKAVEFNMPAVAFSDSGNLMGAFHFVETGHMHNESINLKIKEIKQNENATTRGTLYRRHTLLQSP